MYRPYPDADRARHQLARHARYDDVPVVVSPTAAQFMQAMATAFQPNAERIMANLRAVTQGMPRAADFFPAVRPGPGSGR